MVRTKTRARTFSERYPDGPPNVRWRPTYQPVPNNLIFKDHNNRPALMSWNSNKVQSTLPYLPSWVFYMVHPDVPFDFDGCAFRDSLEKAHCLDLVHDRDHRYEFFFLPGATAEECHAHYLGEMEARGTMWRQIRKVKRAVKDIKQGEDLEDNSTQESTFVQEPTSGEESAFNEEHASDEESTSHQDTNADNQLPGLVWPKHDRDTRSICYRGWFFMYPDAEVKFKGAAGELHDVYLVTFDPIPQEWHEEEGNTFDPMEHPLYSQRMEALGPESESRLASWMEMSNYSHWVEEADKATANAVELGWESW
ncbi:hypothetical protein G7Z17_g1765 [Cylindrodendrum hubeiense]|uniref:Uncharacterized protein n=1 Tax=Cylindrodendrum hubeiense TaxID=595255 RepID=A0A9P5HED5_9HYPO|nr:hypothetical protein G7Z17_g1765 [Cylindrodendrum hubeiense]